MKPVVIYNGLGSFLFKLWMDVIVDKTEGQIGVCKRGTNAGTSQLLTATFMVSTRSLKYLLLCIGA